MTRAVRTSSVTFVEERGLVLLLGQPPSLLLAGLLGWHGVVDMPADTAVVHTQVTESRQGCRTEPAAEAIYDYKVVASTLLLRTGALWGRAYYGEFSTENITRSYLYIWTPK
eukprot:4075780-Pleurochrysis_carterae.AAC.1